MLQICVFFFLSLGLDEHHCVVVVRPKRLIESLPFELVLYFVAQRRHSMQLPVPHYFVTNLLSARPSGMDTRYPLTVRP